MHSCKEQKIFRDALLVTNNSCQCKLSLRVTSVSVYEMDDGINLVNVWVLLNFSAVVEVHVPRQKNHQHRICNQIINN